MREIKFRGKTLDGRWIHGDLWQRPYAKDCVTIVSFMEDTGTTGGLEVIPETVGQYTGLKDKNGKEIYEGDIVRGRIYHMHAEDNVIFQIRWTDQEKGYGMHWYPSEIEVIGNIYENKKGESND